MYKHTKKLIALALTLALALTMNIPAFASGYGWILNPDASTIDGGFLASYKNENGPAMMYVPDDVNTIIGLENPNMTAISVPGTLTWITEYVKSVKQCKEIIYRGTIENLVSANKGKGLRFSMELPNPIPVKNSNGELIGWVGGEYGGVIGGWRMTNMVDTGHNPDCDEIIVIPDGATIIRDTEFNNPNVKAFSVPKDFNVLDISHISERCEEIIYRGTAADLIAQTRPLNVYTGGSYGTGPVIPVKDEQGRYLGFVGGQFEHEIGHYIRNNILTSKPLEKNPNALNLNYQSIPVQDKSGQLLGYIWDDKSKIDHFEVDIPASSVIVASDPENSPGQITKSAGTEGQTTTVVFNGVPANTWYTVSVSWAAYNG